MSNKYLAFDIETAKPLTDDEMKDWKTHRPLGMTCAATLLSDNQKVVVWAGKERMSRQEACDLVNYLAEKAKNGYTILTWNGLGFDFDVLAEESGLVDECRELAIKHVDMMYHIVCKLGYGIKLDAAAKGMGFNGKPEGMNGSKAPVMWAEGRRHEVLEYVSQDVRATLAVGLFCENCGQLDWIARSGNLRTMKLPHGWLTVEEAEKLPKPYTGWMKEPAWNRSEFTEWMQ